MDDSAGTSLGARIKKLRGNLFSQRELADAAGISVDIIRKLEQQTRHTTSIATLHKIARVLEVDIAVLVSQQPHSSDPDKVVAIRRALTPVGDLLDEIMLDGEPVSLREAQRVTDYAWGLYWSGRFDRLAEFLPQAIAQLRATAHAARSHEHVTAHELLARGYSVTGWTLVRLGEQESARWAIREALRACERGSDPLLHATLRGAVVWQLIYEGHYQKAMRVAVRAASGIEPAGDVPLPHLSVYGSLFLHAAAAAGRDQRVDQARELLTESKAIAGRLGSDRNDYETPFGPSQLVARTVNVNVVTDNYVDALDAAKTMPRDTRLPVVPQARHLADVAYAHARLGHVRRGRDTLLAIETMAPDWIRHHPMPCQVATELVRRDRDPVLRALATRLGAGR